MSCTNSPLEFLAAFVIAFLCGVLSVLMLSHYIAEVKTDSQHTRQAV